MPKIKLESENVVAETLLIALYARALEAQQPVPLIRDDAAAALVEQIDYDFARARMHHHDQIFTMMRVREFDRRARDFLARHPQPVVVHIGCGLDTRFERVAARNEAVTWYDLDLPEVIALRFDRPEPRLGAAQWMRHLPPLAKGTGIYHYQLGCSGASR